MAKIARKPTVARGAVIARALVRAWAERRAQATKVLLDTAGPASNTYLAGYCKALEDLDLWLRAQPQRTKRKGGIGR